ncbi:MAG: hypothetical protein ABIK44_00890 [candidate division WOR-3 bacterium]
MAVRLVCRFCRSNNTWAHYEHTPCVRAASGASIYGWDQEAFGPTPDGVPQPQPCPGMDSDSVPPVKAFCKNCRKTFWSTADL